MLEVATEPEKKEPTAPSSCDTAMYPRPSHSDSQ